HVGSSSKPCREVSSLSAAVRQARVSWGRPQGSFCNHDTPAGGVSAFLVLPAALAPVAAMSWRQRAPWRGDGRRKNPQGQGKPYDVCGDCGHWENKSFGNFCCSKCGGEYVTASGTRGPGDAGRGHGGRGAGAAPACANVDSADLRAAAVLLLAAKPEFRDGLAQFVQDEAPVEPEWSAARLQGAASAERTRFTRVVEDAAKAVRLASQDVHHRKTKVQKLEEQLVEARAFLATDTAAHEKASQDKRDADEALQHFNEETWMEEKRKDQRRAREEAEAAVRGPPQGAEVHGGDGARWGRLGRLWGRHGALLAASWAVFIAVKEEESHMPKTDAFPKESNDFGFLGLSSLASRKRLGARWRLHGPSWAHLGRPQAS
ncbi:unnamed protein product, partial [Prorocentrum cordatum]